MTAASPFAQAYLQLSGLGYSCIPLIGPRAAHSGRGKAPGRFVSGAWQGCPDWQQFRTSPLSGFMLQLALKAPDANVGIVCGTPAGEGPDGTPLYVISVDIDTTCPDAFHDIERAIPPSPMRVKGQKGWKAFYRAPASIRSRGYDDARVPKGSGTPRRLVDVLTGFDTRQAVVAPSHHPDGAIYQWLNGEPVAACDLPIFSEADHERLVETLQLHGYDPDAGRQSRSNRAPHVPSDRDESDPFSIVKAAALANIGAWIHDVPGLYGLRPARGGFECVNTLRDSSSGQPLERRKRNLSLQASGIKDFGTGDTWSAIDFVADFCGLSISEALRWLEERLGLAPPDVAIDLGRQAESETAPAPVGAGTKAAQAVPGEAVATVTEPGLGATLGAADEVPPHLLQVPGLVGQIAEWVVASARRPNRAFALAAALLVVGTAAGRKIAGPTGSGTHLYVLALADSGSGKDHALNAIATLLSAAGMERHVGKGEFMSHQALFSDLMQEPLTLCPMDEFGSFLRKINNRNGSGSEKAITGVLRTAWGKSFSTMPSPGWATKTSRPIHSPALSLMGAATDKDFYTAIDGADLDNGFLNRFLLVATKARPPSVEPAVSRHEVPENILSALRDIYNVAGPLERATMHGQSAGAPILTVGWSTPHVKDAFLAFENRIIERAANQPMLARVSEMAIRLATIRALGMHGVADAVVCMDDLEWAMEFATWSAERLIADANEHMAENQTQRDRAKIQRLIRAAGRLTQRDLVRKTKGLKAREVEEITRLLETAELIRIEAGPRAPNGKASKIYVWLGE
jgi:hypothetical protein